VLRPPVVLGPHAVGAKTVLPGAVEPLASRLGDIVRKLPVPIPAPVPSLPVQFIHEDDVGQAFLRCVVGAGPPGAYNITGDGVLTGADVARELGILPLPLPSGPVHRAARAVAAVPTPSFVPPLLEWIEAISHPSIMDATKAKRELGWTPRYTGLEALRDTVGRP
jgi:nucleoside-diphosphate-sugar epimerase